MLKLGAVHRLSRRPRAPELQRSPDYAYHVTQTVLTREFYHDGRGPELVRLHWQGQGAVLAAADYYNPDARHTPEGLRHVRFQRPQVVQITPEEVVNYDRFGLGEALTQFRPAAALDLGRSPWVEAFEQRHLTQCRHYQLMFYDELLDIICEGVESHAGGYAPDPARTDRSATG
jgi:hypothetical protein